MQASVVRTSFGLPIGWRCGGLWKPAVHAKRDASATSRTWMRCNSNTLPGLNRVDLWSACFSHGYIQIRLPHRVGGIQVAVPNMVSRPYAVFFGTSHMHCYIGLHAGRRWRPYELQMFRKIVRSASFFWIRDTVDLVLDGRTRVAAFSLLFSGSRGVSMIVQTMDLLSFRNAVPGAVRSEDLYPLSLLSIAFLYQAVLTLVHQDRPHFPRLLLLASSTKP